MTKSIKERAKEIISKFALAGCPVNRDIYPTAAQIEALLSSDYDGPLLVASFAIYSSDPIAGIGGEAGLKKYEERISPLGITNAFSGDVMGSLMGPEDAIKWKSFDFKRFPNREAVIEYLLGDLEMQRNRAGFVEKMRSFVIRPYED